jgi:hypothetical protein
MRDVEAFFLDTNVRLCWLEFREGRSLRSRERIGWQAKAPAPQKRKPLRTKVGQTLSSVNPAISAIFHSFSLSERTS